MKIWVTFFVSLGLFAQDATQPARTPLGRIIGEVKSKDAGKLTVKADSGDTYAVALQDSTAFVRIPPGEKDLKNATKIAASDVNIGDRVMAQGKVDEAQKSLPAVRIIVMTKSDLEQKQAKERAAWQQRGASGLVSEVGPESITVTTKVRGESKPVTVTVDSNTKYRRYAADSIRFNDAKPSSLAEVKKGDQLRVLGDKNEDGSKIKAEEIVFGTFRAIPATVISVDAATGEIKATDLDTKKPFIVLVTPESQVKKLPEMLARMMAMQVNGGAGAAAGPGGAGMRPPGAPGGQAMPGGPGPAGNGPQQGRPEGPGSQRAPGGIGGPGGPGGGFGGPGGGMRGGDLSAMLDRLPPLNLGELKAGDALIVSSTAAAGSARVSAITVLAGVEPILTSAPRSAGQINLGGWSLDMNMPQ